MRCRMTGEILDPIDAIECDGDCDDCEIGNDPHEGYILPIFEENEPELDKNEPELDKNEPVLERKNPRFRQEKWDKTGMKTVSARLPTRIAERFSGYCEVQGKTKHAVIRDWIKDALEPVTGLSTVHKPPKDRWGKI